jgi:cyclic-di-AMP phosphodiesterase PgpH
MKLKLKHYVQLLGFTPLLLLTLFIVGILQFFIMYNSIKGDTYDIQITQIAQDTIRSPKSVEDVEKTELAREEAAKLIEPVYTMNMDVVNHRISIITSIFDTVKSVKQEMAQLDQPLSKDERDTKLKAALKDITDSQAGFELSNTQLDILLTSTDEELTIAQEGIVSVVKAAYQQAIKPEDVETVQSNIVKDLADLSSFPKSMISAASVIAEASIVENNLLDEEKTNARIEQAKAEVEPKKILQGQIIVREGEAVDREMIRQLELLGLLDQKQSKKPIIGLGLFVLLQMAFLYVVFDRSPASIVKKRKNLFVTTIVFLLSLTIMMLLNRVEENFDVVIAFLFPTAMSTMLVRILASEKEASVITILTAASAGVVFQESFASVLQMDIALYILFGGFGALYFMRNIEKRKDLLSAVAIITIVNVLFIAFYMLLSQATLSMKEALFYLAAAILSGLLSGALTTGLMPFFESAFSILSTMRLIELSNPNHPLLKKILTETPGTYHHSVMVANLAEASCEAIGADGLLARVGCYYHDLGKTVRPYMFIENQIGGMNPHDQMEPEQSAEIILAHTVEGAALLRKHKMPQEIIDIALQHHGTSTLKYFLFKAKEQGKIFDEEIFKYAGPKPQTKEAAVISIADSVEAAVRSMKEPTPEKIQALIHSIIQSRIQEEQFDECDLSMKELKKIEHVLCETLNGIFHSRIEYPK